KYGKGSALWALASLRAEIYHQSLAMLEQKKASLLPFISLRYTVDGKLYSPPPNKEEQLNGLQEERNKLGAELAKTQQAADGSSGLIGALAAVEYMTKAISLAQLDSRIMTLRS